MTTGWTPKIEKHYQNDVLISQTIQYAPQEQKKPYPQRTWVGLTVEDMAICIDEPAWDLILRKAEQILKEKNT